LVEEGLTEKRVLKTGDDGRYQDWYRFGELKREFLCDIGKSFFQKETCVNDNGFDALAL